MLVWIGLSRTTYRRVLQNKVSIDYDYDNGDSLMIIIINEDENYQKKTDKYHGFWSKYTLLKHHYLVKNGQNSFWSSSCNTLFGSMINIPCKNIDTSRAVYRLCRI